jgi:alkanesulfonate monooxygenase SsuD/methylene tetrahydromethanopterin reductase-like flavin-dependent oxidoreductase (luciferase family)
MVEEAVAAEEAGFSFWGASEQHFLGTSCTVSQPDALFGAVAERTSHIKLRYLCAVLNSYNHPITVAERIATLDALSGGRVEVTTARSNNRQTLEAFGVDPKSTAQQWDESLEVIFKALRSDTFHHSGELWQVPNTELTPRGGVARPGQGRLPRFGVAASGQASHGKAGRMGIGVTTGMGIIGWEHVENCIATYLEEFDPSAADRLGQDPQPRPAVLAAVTHCGASREMAFREAERGAFEFTDLAIWMFSRLAPTSPEYAYMDSIHQIEDRKRDLEFLNGHSPYLMIGTADDILEDVERLAALGYKEIVMRIDGMPHATVMESIERIGADVLPRIPPD